jgi:hypothetical protein
MSIPPSIIGGSGHHHCAGSIHTCASSCSPKKIRCRSPLQEDHHQAASRKSGADHLSWPHITKSVQKNQPRRTLNPSSLNLAMIYLAHACITANGAHSSSLRPSLCRIHLSAPSQRLTDGFLQVPATSGSHLLLNCGRANPRTPFYLGKTPKIDLSTF